MSNHEKVALHRSKYRTCKKIEDKVHAKQFKLLYTLRQRQQERREKGEWVSQNLVISVFVTEVSHLFGLASVLRRPTNNAYL